MPLFLFLLLLEYRLTLPQIKCNLGARLENTCVILVLKSNSVTILTTQGIRNNSDPDYQ